MAKALIIAVASGEYDETTTGECCQVGKKSTGIDQNEPVWIASPVSVTGHQHTFGMRSHALEVAGELRIVTESSVWLIRTNSYCRMPRNEQPRPATGPELVDGLWHPHIGVWLMCDRTSTWVRILPPNRPPGSTGIFSGPIIAIEPMLETIAEICRPSGQQSCDIG